MLELDNIRDLDDLIFDEFQKYFPKTVRSDFAKKFPKTFYLSTTYVTSTNFIKNSIYECATVDDMYGVKILFRSLIEHSLRFQFVCFNWMKTKTDLDAIKYLEFSDAKEAFEHIRSAIDSHKLSYPDYEVLSWQKLFEQFPSLKKYSKKEIEEESRKYTYKNIVKILKEVDLNDNSESTFLNSVLVEYSKLSAFVHGGAESHKQMMLFGDSDLRITEYHRIYSLAFQMAGSAKLFTLLMLVQTDKSDFAPYYLTIDKILKRIDVI